MPRPVVIDTDPGQDDAVALLTALASPELDVLGITTVAGNVPLPLTTRNALSICELAGRTDVGVYAGCERPLVRTLVTAEYVHGVTGLDGANLPPPTTAPQPEHAVDWLVATLMDAADRSVTLCPLGPLTNVGLALARQPAVASKIREIVLMGGGCFEGGNVTPAAEFNIYVDPHAASIVFASGVPIVMMPLDVTHRALVTPERLAAFRALASAVGDAVWGMLDFFDRYDMEKYGSAGAPLHDPCVIGYLLDPALFTGRPCNVQIETASELTMGMTVIDWWGVTGREVNAMVMNQVDADALFALITARLASL